MTDSVADTARCPVEFDHESPEHAARWESDFSEMRAKCPIAWTEQHGGYWVATRYHDIIAIAQDSETFTNGKTYNPETGEVRGGLSIPPEPTYPGFPDESDSPDWDNYRGFLNRRFAPKAVETRRERTERFAAALLDAKIETGEIDLVDDFTNPLPAIATMDIFGLPLEEWRTFADPLHRMMYTPKNDPEFPQIIAAYDWIRERIEEEVAKRRADPREDLLTHLAFGEIDGAPLDPETLWGMAKNIIIGGVDTTTALTSNVLLYLSENPEARRYLMEDRSRLAVAREEFVRYFSPIHGLARNASRDVALNGADIAEGERVYLAYSSGNRDETVFEAADEVRLDRFPNRHIGFGAGRHRCLGSFQARMMFETMMNAVFDRLPDYEVDAAAAQRYPCLGMVNGLISLPAKFTPGPRIGASIG